MAQRGELHRIVRYRRKDRNDECPCYWDDTDGCWTDDLDIASRRTKTTCKEIVCRNRLAECNQDDLIAVEPVQVHF